MGRHDLELGAPAAGFIESFLLGNGSLGAAVHGLTTTERIDLNLDTLWAGGPALAGLPDRSVEAARLRTALREGDLVLADQLARQTQGPGYTASYQPLSRLELPLPRGAGTTGYRRSLDMAGATATTEMAGPAGDVRVTAFVSAPDDVLVVHVAGAEVEPRLSSPHPAASGAEQDGAVGWAWVGGRAPVEALPDYVDAPGGGVRYGEDAPDDDGLVDAGTGFAAVAATTGDGAGGTLVVLAAASGFRGFDQRPSADVGRLREEARAVVEAALARGLDELRQRHAREHASWWDRMDLEVVGGAAARAAEQYVHLGRYLLIASSRPGTQPANLQGIWNPEVRPAWSCNLTTNINAQMNYWGAELAGLGELHRPLLALAGELAVAGRAAARATYGAAGASTGHNTDLWRRSAPVQGEPFWANWSSGLAWLAAHPVEHVAFAASDQRAALAREVALPVLREVVRFVLDGLDELDDGSLVLSPSSSPEHRFVRDGVELSVTRGAAMDQELAVEALSHYVRLAGDHGTGDDADLVTRAASAVGRLRRPLVVDGEVREWVEVETPFEEGHRHLSHLYGVFPGARVHLEDGGPGLEAARRALARRLDAGSGYTGWSQAWVLCLAARLRDATLAERALAVLAGELSSASLLDLHPHDAWPEGAVFQVDGNLGALAGAVELLVQSHAGVVSVLDAVPPSWEGGALRGARARGGHAVDLAWDGAGLTELDVVVGGDGELVLEVPAQPPVEVEGTATATAREVPGAAAGRRRLAVRATAGQRVRLRRRSP